MKKTTKLPRRVASSLVHSLAHFAEEVIRQKQNDSNGRSHWDSNFVAEYDKANRAIISDTDLNLCQNIVKFQKALTDHDSDMPDEAFVTIANQDSKRIKYVVNETSVGLVITSGAVFRVCELATLVVGKLNVHSKKQGDWTPIYLCDNMERNRYDTHHQEPRFIRLLDVLRYMDETNIDVVEMNISGYQNDRALMTNDRYRYGYGRLSKHDLQKFVAHYPMLSDRFQEDSWKHYLNTLYKGIINVNEQAPIITTLNKSVCMSELQLVGNN